MLLGSRFFICNLVRIYWLNNNMMDTPSIQKKITILIFFHENEQFQVRLNLYKKY
jgi:hypothetical protein